MESRFRVRCLGLLGASVAVIALASCGDDSPQVPTSTTASITTTSPTSTTTTSSTTTAPSSTTTAPSETTKATADFDVSVDVDTEWGEVFDALTTTEQECIRDSFEGDLLGSVLARPVMSESDTPETWEVSMFSCLAPQTARALFLALLVSGMEEDGVFLMDADAQACLDAWVAGIDVVATMVALSADDAEAAGEVTTAFMRCNPDLFISLMLEETGMTLEDLSDEEATCLRNWATGTDWTTLLTSAATDPSPLFEFLPGLVECAPDLFLFSMLEEFDLTLEDLGAEEATCLREWVAGTDWTTLFTSAATDPSPLFDFLPGLFDCLPDLTWLGAGARLPAAMVDEATPVRMDVVTQGELEFAGDSHYFAFDAQEDELYELDVTLGTLQDSLLQVYEADGAWLDGNDDYGDSSASRLIWHAPSTDTYYVEVSSFGTGTGTYTLTISLSDEDDHPNTTANATPVEIGAIAQGELEYNGDIDVFTFEATEGVSYELDVTLGTLLESVLWLYGADGNWLAGNEDYGDPTASGLIWHAPSTGTYYVYVASYGADLSLGTGTYTLTIAITDTVDDHSNAAGDATPITIGEALRGEMEYEGDSDYFTFEAEGGAFYQLEVTLGTLLDSVLDIYDADGAWLDGNDDYGDSTASRLVWDAPSTGTYYVEVSSFDLGTGTYTLTITPSQATST